MSTTAVICYVISNSIWWDDANAWFVIRLPRNIIHIHTYIYIYIYNIHATCWTGTFRFHSFKEFETNCGLRGELTLVNFDVLTLMVLSVLGLEANLLFLFNFFPEFDSEDRKSPWMSLRMVGLLYCVNVCFVALLRF